MTLDMGLQMKVSEDSEESLNWWELQSSLVMVMRMTSTVTTVRLQGNLMFHKANYSMGFKASLIHGLPVKADPVIICKIHQIVLVKMYQFLNSHDLKVCHKLLV